MVNTTAFMAAMRCEWRILRLDPALWLVQVMIVATVAYALHNGGVMVERHNAAVAAAMTEEAGRLAHLRQSLADIESGSAAPPSMPFRDPRNALFMGSGAAATHAVLPLQPLALTAVGQSDLYPATLRVSAATRDTFIFSDEIANPSHLLSGSFDLAFVLVFLYPLWILALTYNLVSGEREQGTLALTAACPVPLRSVLAGKLLVRAGLPMLFTLAVVVVGLFIALGDALLSAITALLALLLAITLYGVFWAGLAAAINGLGRDSAYNALLLVVSWIALLLVVPALINGWSEWRHPSPSRAEMVLAVRAAAVDGDRERDASLARYQEEHGHSHSNGDALQRGSYRERTQRRLAVQELAMRRVEEIMVVHDQRLLQQQALSSRLGYLSPALLMHLALAEIAGTGHGRYGAFFNQVEQFHRGWRDFFISKAKTETWLEVADYSHFPRFSFVEVRAPAFFGRVAPSVVGITVLLFCIALVATRTLRRCRVVG